MFCAGQAQGNRAAPVAGRNPNTGGIAKPWGIFLLGGNTARTQKSQRAVPHADLAYGHGSSCDEEEKASGQPLRGPEAVD